MNKNEKSKLENMLREGIVTVNFTKKDGSERKMTCTLLESKIPNEKMPKTEKKSKNLDVLAVFDVEIDAWRSFRYDSVINFE
jgi:hypothetical protein